MLSEIARFFVSACKFSASDFRYHTENMMGPDEFHENMMTQRTKEVLQIMPTPTLCLPGY